MAQGKVVDRELRIAAVADYLIGVPLKVIEERYPFSHQTVQRYAEKAGFKLVRKKRDSRYAVRKVEVGKEDLGYVDEAQGSHLE